MADIARGVRSFTIGTAISRVMGLVREIVLSHLFGAGFAMDAFNAAFRIPNFLRDLFAENALSAAFVPVLTSEKSKGKDAENLFASNIFNTLLIVVGAVSIAGIFLSPWLAKFIAFGFKVIPGKLELTGKLTAIMFPFLLFIALGAWAMSYLNTEGAFFVPSLAPSFFNVFSILTPVALFAYLKSRGINPIYGLALGVMVGGLMQFGVQVPRLYQRGFRYKLYINFRNPEFLRVMALFLPVVIGLSGERINVLVNTMLITRLQEGSLSWLNYAFRIMHLPLGMFGIAVGTVALPTFARMIANGSRDMIPRTLNDSLKMVLFLTIPSSALIAFLASPITSLIYEHGRFTAADTAATASILVLYMLGVPFVSILRNVAGVFYACKDARSPMLASFASVAVNLALNLSLMNVLGYRAFPLSASIAAVVNIAILFLQLPRKIGAFPLGGLAVYSLRLAVASTLSGAAAYGVFLVVPSTLSLAGASFLAKLAGVVLGAAVALPVFYVASRILGISEVRSYTKRFLKR
jgi:putative peptidoglycan lipid II flippase